MCMDSRWLMACLCERGRYMEVGDDRNRLAWLARLG